jgi:hypothetical protein
VPPALELRVCYDCDWVESFYEAEHTVWITVTESDGVTVKAKAEAVTERRDSWDGEPGFQTQAEDWDPDLPDIQSYDWVYGSVDNGASAQMQIGEIGALFDYEADTIEGTINAPWLSGEVNVECGITWNEPEPPPDTKFASVLPNGRDTFSCSWAGEGNMQPGQDMGVGYAGADGHSVLRFFSANAEFTIAASIDGDYFNAAYFSPDASVTIAIYESEDGGSALLWEGSRTADKDGFVGAGPSDHALDLQPGNYLTVSDGLVRKGLVLESITIDTFDVDQDLVAGTAPPGRDVLVTIATSLDASNGQTLNVTADPESGQWTADFKTVSVDITEQMRRWSFAQVYDDDGDYNEIGSDAAAAAPPTETPAPVAAAATATPRPTDTQPPPTPTPQPTRTPAPTPLPGIEVIPIGQMATSIPWLPQEQGRAVQTIYFNVSSPPFDDRRVRQAFSLAVNRVTVANAVSSLGVIDPRPATTFTAPQVLGRDLYRQIGLGYDPDRARQLLAAAGYPNGAGFPQVTLVSDRTEVKEAVVNTVADMWRQQLGVSVNVELMEQWSSYWDRLRTDAPDAFRLGWRTERDPQGLNVFHSGSGDNVAHFSDSGYDRLIDQAEALAGDPAARQALYIEAERILCEQEAVIIPLYHYYME